MDNTVSVVIPCYNGSAFLRESIKSALQQTSTPMEVIVVDDGSTDDSASIAQSFGPVVRVIKQRNQGESVARNRGMDETRGAWIAFLDADDRWEPDKITSQLSIANARTMAVCTATRFFSNEMVLDKSDSIWTPEPKHLSEEHVFTYGAPFHISSLMVRRDLCARFPSWTQHGEDSIFILELLREIKRKSAGIKTVSDALTGYRRHSKNQSRGKEATVRWFESFEQWIEKQRDCESDATVSGWQRQLLRLITNAIDATYWKRDWAQHRYLQSYIKRRSDLNWPNYLRKRFPSFVYRLKDGMDRNVAVRQCIKGTF